MHDEKMKVTSSVSGHDVCVTPSYLNNMFMAKGIKETLNFLIH